MFAESRGYSFDYVALPVRRLFVELVAGAGDLKYPDNPNWAGQIKGETEIACSAPVVRYVNGVMVPPETLRAGADRIRLLGIVAGWTPVGWEDGIGSGRVDLVENNSYEGLLRQAVRGRVDGAYSNVATSRFYLANEIGAPGALVFDPDLPHIRSNRVLSSVKHPELIAEFDRFHSEYAIEIDALKAAHKVEDETAPQ